MGCSLLRIGQQERAELVRMSEAPSTGFNYAQMLGLCVCVCRGEDETGRKEPLCSLGKD